MIMAAQKGPEVRGTKSGTAIISKADRAKLANWGRPPNDKLYLANKKVYDDKRYFDQKTGDVIYPGTERVDPTNPGKKIQDPNIHGFKNGEFRTEQIPKGKVKIGRASCRERVKKSGSNGHIRKNRDRCEE